MADCRYPLAAPTLGREEQEALRRVIEGGQLTMGPNVAEFERRFAARFGVRHALLVNSGSSANLVGIAALFFRKESPLRRGDEVIVPCIAWATTYYPLLQYGLKLRFVDVDLETLTYDTAALADAVSERTRVIVAVNVLGNPCDFDPILELCRQRGIILFEDNCESLGARYGGRNAGTYGLIGTCSTFYSHQLTTIEGGLILTDDFEIACLARSLRNHGWTRDQDAGSTIFEKSAEDMAEGYRFILPGYNVRGTELQAAVGIEQLDKFDRFLAIRRRNARHFRERFGVDERFILQKENGESSWFSFTMIVRPEGGLTRGRVFEALRVAAIDFRIITGGNFLRHDVIRYFDYDVVSSRNADLAHDNGFFVGNYACDLREEIDHLWRTLDRL
ncbi:MAG: DegT/DnrJ/EryC1/StrS family aminotransferase [Candidatus Methylomirabilia bacterium]